MNLNIVILAAGQGKRMYSQLPKVLHKIGNKPLLQHVIETALELTPRRLIIIYGHSGDIVNATINKRLPDADLIWVKQEQQLGTGHALQCALPYLDESSATLVLYGDVPLIRYSSLHEMLEKYNDNIVMLTAHVSNPIGYGRVIRNELKQIVRIAEEKDATPDERAISEVNTGFYVLPTKSLTNWLKQLSNNNQQQEYYLTDVIDIAVKNNTRVDYVLVKDHAEILGINNKLQLEQVERFYQMRLANQLLECGVTILDKSRLEIRGVVIAGLDCVIDVNCVLEGSIKLGDNVVIGAGCILKDVTIGNNVTIKPYSIIEGMVSIGDNCQIGPFSRLRPESNIASSAHIGNFVEIKKSNIGIGSKINHLTYIGDAIIGEAVNVGAGSITCNYDGVNKWQTIIKDKAFIGSGTMMVAPVTIHQGSIIGAGSTITKNTEANELTVARSKQVTVKGWVKKHSKK